ncbi:cytochrome P450, partial [Pisolithus marmoratus]
MLDQCLSQCSMGDLTAPIALALYGKIKPYTQMKNARVTLEKFLKELLYCMTNLVMFGSRYPETTYEDLRTPDATMPERFYKIAIYLTKDVSEEDGWLGSAFKRLFQDNNTALHEASSHLLTFQWGMHTNMSSIGSWLFLFLLRHLDAFLAVQNEIDKAVKEDFGDLESFIANVNPQTLDKPCFALLTSALFETMRLTAIFVALRIAESDLQLEDQGERVAVPKGEYVMGNVQAVHMNESSYPDHHKFVFNRFAHGEYCEGRLPTEGQLWLCFASGRHLASVASRTSMTWMLMGSLHDI